MKRICIDKLWRAGYAACGLSLLMGLSGCRKDLCYDHDEHALTVKTDIAATWELEWERDYGRAWEDNWLDEWELAYDDLRPDAGEGIAAMVYHADGTSDERHLEADGGRLHMDEGTHSILFYNDDTEYIVFDDIASSATATATTRTRTRATLTDLRDDEPTITAPDMLYGHYIDTYVAERTLEPVNVPVEMRPLTYTYLLRYEFSHGLQYVALARGALAGMAESVYLMDGHTGPESATVLFDDGELKSYGVEKRIQTFGIPNYPGDDYTKAEAPEPGTYILNLELRLTNGKVLPPMNFDVTEQVKDQPRGGVITVTGIEVSDEDGMEGGAGFDPDVEGWGEYEDIEVPVS